MFSMPNPAIRSIAVLALCLAQASCIFEGGPEGPSQEERVELHYENALRFHEMGELERALDQAQRGLEADPRDRRLRLLTAMILVRRETRVDLATAESLFRGLRGEQDYRVDLGLATCLERKGLLFDEAARAGKPKHAGEAQKSWREAVELYERVLADQRGDREALNGLMRTHALLGQDAQSFEVSGRLIASVGQHTTFWQGQLTEDISASREAQIRGWLAGNTQLVTKTHLHRASILRRLDRQEEAIQELQAVIELDPEIPEVHSRLAQQLFEVGRYEEARHAIDRYLALSDDAFDDPNYQRAWDLRNDADAALRERGRPAPR
ncbi:MAG: tetratricopeptide (TPR) repeat protein [Chlamydiales bacterium]|jgi:tetratricopeptide (TPR) repeat protein